MSFCEAVQLRSSFFLILLGCVWVGGIFVVAAAGLVNINTAGQAELETLPGIGESKAGAIIEYRGTNGPFAVIEDIQNVSGIGAGTFANIKDLITVGGTPAQPSVDDEDENGNQTATTTATITQTNAEHSGGNETISLTVPEDVLVVSITAPGSASVHQPVAFSAESSGIADTLLDSLSYTWNFGDAETGTGKGISHTYGYPGTYVVYLEADFAHYHAVTRYEMTIVPVTLSLKRTATGDVQVTNSTDHEVDIGGYTMRAGKNVILPAHTVLVAGGSLTISRDKVGTGGTVVLYDTVGTIRASEVPTAYVAVSTHTPPRPVVETADIKVKEHVPDTSSTAEPAADKSEGQQAAALASGPGSLWSEKLPYLGLLGLLALGILGVLTRKA